jgi:hypothetical protein
MFIRGLVACALLGACLAPEARAAVDRFLYIVSCDAQLSKVDTQLDTMLSSVDLATRTGGHKFIPDVRGVLDGCLTYQAVYDPLASRFYTIVPQEAEPKANGTKDYRVLGFSIPETRLESEALAGTSLSDPPHIQIDRAYNVIVVRASDWSPQADMDLRGFGPDDFHAANQILEVSGHHVLLRLFSASSDGLTLAVADRETKKLFYLHEIPPTTALNVHLAPGGLTVLVEEAVSGGGSTRKTGRLILFDVPMGRAIATVDEPVVRDMAFLAISPNGKAIYHRNDNYRFIGLGRAFSSDPVSRPFAGSYPGYFFADR